MPERGHFYVIQRGVVLYSARVLTAGKSWGEDFILSNEKALASSVARGRPSEIRRHVNATLASLNFRTPLVCCTYYCGLPPPPLAAMTYVEVYALSRPYLFATIEHFPIAQRLVRRAVLTVALRREMIARKRTEEKRQGETDFIDAIIDASFKQTSAKSSDQSQRLAISAPSAKDL